MMAAAMTYALAIGLLLTLAALAAERCVEVLGQSRRAVWMAAMAASVASMILVFVQKSPAAHGVASRVAPIDLGADSARMVFSWIPSPAWPVWSGLDAILIALWALMSAAMLMALAATSWRFHERARRWPIVRLNDQAVSVADDVGPAVFGALKPRIVLPRWILDTPHAVQSTALRHEQQHVAAGDSLLFMAALLLLALAPWNLPLWLQLRRLRFAIEVDCDARMLKSGIDAGAYGEALLAVGQHKSNTPVAAIALAEPVSHLERRIRIMLLDKPRARVVASLGFLALAGAPVVYAADLQPPDQTAALAGASGVTFSSDHVESTQGGATLVLSGNVQVRVPAHATIDFSSDRVMHQADGAEVFDGAVSLTIEQSRIDTERASVTRAENGDAIIIMDQAQVTQSR